MSDRNKAFELQGKLEDDGISDHALLEFLINNWLSGAEALQAMQAALVEFGLEEEDQSSDDEEEDFTYCGACGGDASLCDGC